jgi:CheY-like chemotaxis protein
MAKVPEVLVVDQDPRARFELKQLVRQAQMGFAGEAGLGTDAVSLAGDVKPDVIICGMSRPPERSLQTIEALLDVLPERRSSPTPENRWTSSAGDARRRAGFPADAGRSRAARRFHPLRPRV